MTSLQQLLQAVLAARRLLPSEKKKKAAHRGGDGGIVHLVYRGGTTAVDIGWERAIFFEVNTRRLVLSRVRACAGRGKG